MVVYSVVVLNGLKNRDRGEDLIFGYFRSELYVVPILLGRTLLIKSDQLIWDILLEFSVKFFLNFFFGLKNTLKRN